MCNYGCRLQCICWMRATSQPLEPSAGLTRFQTSSKPTGGLSRVSRTVPEKRTLAQCLPLSVAISSRSASSPTTSVCCGALARSCTSLLSSLNISAVVNSRISSSLPASLAACSLTKFSLAPRRKLAVSKPAGTLGFAVRVSNAAPTFSDPIGCGIETFSLPIPASCTGRDGAASSRRRANALKTNTAPIASSAINKMPPNPPRPANIEPSSPPIARPPSIGRHRLKRLGVGCGGAAGAACCPLGLAGADAGGVLLCAPMERPPPSFLASASVASSATPIISPQTNKNNLFMVDPPRIFYMGPILSLSNPIPAMHRHHTSGKVKELDSRQTRVFHHPRERRLVWVHADRFGEVLVGCRIAGDALAQPRQHLEGVQVVGGLQRLPDLGGLGDP